MNMLDMMGMMGKLKEAQAKIKDAQGQLAQITAQGEAGGGMVKAVVNGSKRVLSLQIDPDLLKKEDQDMVQDLSVAAINNALSKVEELANEHLKKATEGMLPAGMPNIPGLDKLFS
jgi:nucleoid-associated protein EbfC